MCIQLCEVVMKDSFEFLNKTTMHHKRLYPNFSILLLIFRVILSAQSEPCISHPIISRGVTLV